MSQFNYDLVVIGGGTGGYTGAIRAARLGLKTALIEEKHLGGTCLNHGCIPTKTLLHSAQIFADHDQWGELGISAQNVALDQDKIYARKAKIVQGLRDGIALLLRANGVDLFKGHGTILTKNSVGVDDKTLSTKFILIATGSSPAGFDPDRPLNGIEKALNSDDVLSAPITGKDIIIVGGGVIAVEFAFYFALIGKNTTMLLSGERILSNLSRDISMQLTAVLKRKGVKIIALANIKQLTQSSAQIQVDGQVQTLNADAVIAAVGRKNNLSDLGLGNVNLATGKFLRVDKNMCTDVKNIYACGDITGGIQLAHYAAASAITAVESMLGKGHSINLDICPACIYTQPEIAVVGAREDEVQSPKIGKFMMGGNGKSIIEGLNRGYVKVIADQNGILKGAEVFAARGTDIIGELTLAIQKGITAQQALSAIRPHPTVMEAVGEALEDIYGLATHIPPR